MVAGDASRAVRRLGSEGARFDLVLLDPPYASDELRRALEALAEAGVVAPEGVVVVEHGKRQPVPEVAGWEALEAWSYGETQVTRLVAAGRPTGSGDSER